MNTLEIVQQIHTLEMTYPSPAVLEIAVQTLELFEVAQQGVMGPPGKSAYQLWLEAGNVGTEVQFQAQLTGPEYSSVRNKPLAFIPLPHQHVQADIPELEPLVNLVVLFENALV